MKKQETLLKEPVTELLKIFTKQIRYQLYQASAIVDKQELFEPSQLKLSQIVVDYTWNSVEIAVDDVERELNSLISNKDWPSATVYLATLQLRLERFETKCFRDNLLIDYVTNCKEKNIYKELVYVSSCNSIVYGNEIGVGFFDPLTMDSQSFDCFYKELAKIWKYIIASVEKLEKQLFEKRYNKKWDKFSERDKTIHDVFNDSQNLIYALKKLEEKELVVIKADSVSLTYKERGRKRLLAAWLTKCYNKGFISAKYDFTTCAKVVLTYFGYTVNGPNDVRDFLGSDNIPDKYYDLLGKW